MVGASPPGPVCAAGESFPERPGQGAPAEAFARNPRRGAHDEQESRSTRIVPAKRATTSNIEKWASILGQDPAPRDLPLLLKLECETEPISKQIALRNQGKSQVHSFRRAQSESTGFAEGFLENTLDDCRRCVYLWQSSPYAWSYSIFRDRILSWCTVINVPLPSHVSDRHCHPTLTKNNWVRQCGTSWL